MLEMLKSKTMVLFVIFMLGVIYFCATPQEKMEDVKDAKETIISYHVK